MTPSTSYVIITPVRDEEVYLGKVIDSVCGQTVQPAQWTIVDDGSTDQTGQIADAAAAAHPWIHVVHRGDRGFRKSGGGVVEAFYAGYSSLQHSGWDFIVKLDADLSFARDYFEKCFEHFSRDRQLGIGGGEICHEVAGQLKVEQNPRFHVRGATKIYRRECWEAIGGLWPAPGWDTIDEVKANMLGWKTYAFTHLPVAHYRVTGTEDGLIRDRVKHGVACYVSGYHPLFVAASCVRRLTAKPRIVGSAAILYGFVKSYFTRPPRVQDDSYVSYIRRQQMNRLRGLETIWR